MSDWPHDRIHAVALRYIRKHTTNDTGWQFTHIDELPERLARVVQLNPGERSLVSCFIDGQRWFVMTTARIFGVARGSRFECSPLDVTQWRWGEIKGGDSDIEIATLALTDGTHLRMSYESGRASMAPIYYEHFWRHKYPILEKLE